MLSFPYTQRFKWAGDQYAVLTTSLTPMLLILFFLPTNSSYKLTSYFFLPYPHARCPNRRCHLKKKTFFESHFQLALGGSEAIPKCRFLMNWESSRLKSKLFLQIWSLTIWVVSSGALRVSHNLQWSFLHVFDLVCVPWGTRQDNSILNNVTSLCPVYPGTQIGLQVIYFCFFMELSYLCDLYGGIRAVISFSTSSTGPTVLTWHDEDLYFLM